MKKLDYSPSIESNLKKNENIKNNKKSGKGNIIFVVLFFLIVLFPVFTFTPHKEISESENRMLTALDFSNAPGIGGKIDVAEKYFSDHLGGRDAMFRYVMGAKYYMFGVINYLDMTEGTEKGQWYSIDAYQEMDYTGVDPYLTEEQLEVDVNGLSKVNEWMKERNTPFVVMINPDKIEVEDQYLPKRYIKNKNGFRSDRFARALREKNVPVVLSKESLLSYEGDEHLFWDSTDVTHWNYLGAYLAYEQLMGELTKYKDVPVLTYEDFDFEEETVDSSFIWGIKWADTTKIWDFDNSMVDSDSDLPDELSFVQTYYHFHNYDLEDENSKILIAGDSYIEEYLMDPLKHSYTDVYFVIGYQNRDAVLQMTEMINPDVVLFEWASRMYPRMNGGVGAEWGL